MIRYTYLMIDLLSLSVPLIFSFHPRIKLYKNWNALFPSILIVAAGYTLWDSFFTKLGIWGFNPTYLTGIRVGNLPIEEILFFICIPYSCVFTFECLSPMIPAKFPQSSARIINYTFAGLFTLIALAFYSRPYTASAFGLLSALIFTAVILKTTWLTKFYLVYAVLIIPFLVVNGLLTGTGLSSPIVWYNPTGIIGARILTIPFEDIFYGMGLILANVWLYTLLRSRQRLMKRILS
ncbi:MAG: lycopene cyclase domain-containing protein [Bacteroidetes bacterium]|nr:lycopene cyclase domain-containing protein [Bacteroidota bacterium]